MGAQLSNLSDYIMKDKKVRKTCKYCRNYLPRDKDKQEFCSDKCRDKFIKQYCIDTIKHGNRKKIQLVLTKYWKILEDSKNSADIVKFAEKLFE